MDRRYCWPALYRLFNSYTRKSIITAERQFALEHGCQPLKPWKARWPLGLDILAKAFWYDHKKQILRFFIHVFDESGITSQQLLLGGRSVNTIDPRNIEAVLSTNFAGTNNKNPKT